MSEPLGANDFLERCDPNFPFSDVIVPINSRSQRRLGIVQVPGRQAIDANFSFELLEGPPKTFRGTNIIASGEQMRGVETNQQPLPITAGCDDASKLAKSVSQGTPLTRSNFERDFAARLWQIGKYCIQTLCYQLNAGTYTCAEVGTGMKDEKG